MKLQTLKYWKFTISFGWGECKTEMINISLGHLSVPMFWKIIHSAIKVKFRKERFKVFRRGKDVITVGERKPVYCSPLYHEIEDLGVVLGVNVFQYLYRNVTEKQLIDACIAVENQK